MSDLFAGTAYERLMPAQERRRWGRFYTAPACVDLVLRLCLHTGADCVLDPSCGTGVFLAHAALRKQDLGREPGAGNQEPDLWGVDVDREAAAEAEQNLAAQGLAERVRILCQDFLSLGPGDLPVFDCIVGNPPYTRQEWMRELAPDGDVAALTRRALGGAATLTRRAGLYAYFFVHAARFLREGGRLGLIASNSWLDVDYGAGLQAFLLGNFRILAIVESNVERWFADAGVNTCLAILERCSDAGARESNPVRFTRLMRPLAGWLPIEAAGVEATANRGALLDHLARRLLTGESGVEDGELSTRIFRQGDLAPRRPAFGSRALELRAYRHKWGALLRAPQVDLDVLDRSAEKLVPLKALARIQRGSTTGANEFFYLARVFAAEWAIESEFLRPLLKSPRDCPGLVLEPEALPYVAFVVHRGKRALAGTNALRYIEWGESRGFHTRPTCAGRERWYDIGERPPADLAWIKGVWARHFCPLLPAQPIVLDQQLYGIGLREPSLRKVTAALLNSTWTALCAEMGGRVNLGEGILWIAAYEAGQLLLPDPARIPDGQSAELESALDALCARPVLPVQEQILQPERERLDEVVFDLLEMQEGERRAIRAAVVETARARWAKAERRRTQER